MRLASVVGQVEDVAGDVLLRGDVGQHPRLLGGRHLQPTHGTVSTLAAPGGRGGAAGRGGVEESPQLEAAMCLTATDGGDTAASPFVDALLTEAVSAGQDEVGLAVHADAALLLVGQLLDPAQQIRARYETHINKHTTASMFSHTDHMVNSLPAHPHAGLARLSGGQLGGSGALC